MVKVYCEWRISFSAAGAIDLKSVLAASRRAFFTVKTSPADLAVWGMQQLVCQAVGRNVNASSGDLPLCSSFIARCSTSFRIFSSSASVILNQTCCVRGRHPANSSVCGSIISSACSAVSWRERIFSRSPPACRQLCRGRHRLIPHLRFNIS